MVVIDGRPPPGRMLEPYITSVPGVQPTRNSTVMQTRPWSSRGPPQVGCTVSRPSHSAIARSLSGKLVEQRLASLEVSGIEALGEQAGRRKLTEAIR